MSTKNVVVLGATGNQGGAVVKQLANNPAYTVLAVTRNPSSEAAKKISGSNVKVVKGDMSDCAAIFRDAKSAAGGDIYGVFSVQLPAGPAGGPEVSTKQGTDMIDAAKAAGVKHFVYTSVERGGDDKSWNNACPAVTDYNCKYKIEQHLKTQAGSMGWTVLRPVALMDNIKPEMKSKIFVSALKSELKDTKLQWVSARDVGVFAKMTLDKPEEFNGKAIGLAGDALTVPELIKVTKDKTGQSLEPKMMGMGFMLKTILGQLSSMLTWMRTEGYKADIARCKQMNPGMLSYQSWLAQESEFPKK